MLVEREVVSRIGKLVKPYNSLTSDKPNNASEWARIFVPNRLGVKKSRVRRDTAAEIADCQSHMGDCRTLRL